MIATLRPPIDQPSEAGGRFPPTVELILSALETGQHARHERRMACRAPYRATAKLRLFSDLPDTPPWLVYTRDANHRGLGFLTSHRLPLGYGGMLDLLSPDGQAASIPCTLIRCRQAAPGWYEGSLHFNREQPQFAQPNAEA
jgi:hypothetical protein